jgi:ankyrin repeat protein
MDSLALARALQSILLDFSPTAWLSALNESLPSPASLASAIIVTATARPALIPQLADFSVSLNASSVPELSHALLKSLMRSFSWADTFPVEAPSFAFLFQGFQRRLFGVSEIVDLARALSRDAVYRKSSWWLLCYFAPELSEADPALADYLIGDIGKSSSSGRPIVVFQQFSESVDRLRRSNWSLLRQQRDFFGDGSNLVSVIMADDIESLRAAGVRPGFSVTARLAPTPHLPSAALLSHPTLIQIAALFGATECFRWLLANGADVRASDRCYGTLAQFAVAGGGIEIVRICQQYGLDFSATVHSAVRWHRHAIFDWFIDGGDPEELDLLGQRPIHVACKSDNLYALERLLAAGSDINCQASYRQVTPLRGAVRRGRISAVRALLARRGIAVDSVDPNGLTPLALAAVSDDIECAKELINHGARFDTGKSPLLLAAQHRHPEMVGLFLDADGGSHGGGAALVASIASGCDSAALRLAGDPRVDVNYATPEGVTALILAARRCARGVFSELFSRRDALITPKTAAGATLLHAAARDPEIAAAVLTRGGIDVNARDCSGETALHKAAFAGEAMVVKMLLAQPGMDPNIVTNRGGSALHHAIAGGNSDIAEILVRWPEMDVNWRSLACASPLNLAIQGNLMTVVRALCAREDLVVDGNIGVRNGWPPLAIAAHCGSAEAIALVLAHPQMKVESEKCGVRMALGIARKRGFAECARLLREKRTADVPHEKRARNVARRKRRHTGGSAVAGVELN